MRGVQLFDDIYITDWEPWLVTWEKDISLVEVETHFNLAPLNGRMFIFGVTKVFEKVGNAADDGERYRILVDKAFLSLVVVVRDKHANHSLVEQVGEEQVPKAIAWNCG